MTPPSNSSHNPLLPGDHHVPSTITGTFECKDGTIYEGELKNGKAHGKGTMTYTNGEVHRGEFVNGEFHGYIITTWDVDGWPIVVERTFREGKEYGPCRFTTPDFVTEVDDVSAAQQYGTTTFNNGNTYKGELKDYVPCGQGTLTCPAECGKVYRGEFQRGTPHGPGVITYRDGATFEATWKDGKVHGPARCFQLNYITEEDVDGVPIGTGTMRGTMDQEGIKYKGELKDPNPRPRYNDHAGR